MYGSIHCFVNTVASHMHHTEYHAGSSLGKVALWPIETDALQPLGWALGAPCASGSSVRHYRMGHLAVAASKSIPSASGRSWIACRKRALYSMLSKNNVRRVGPIACLNTHIYLKRC